MSLDRGSSPRDGLEGQYRWDTGVALPGKDYSSVSQSGPQDQ